jgi:hypothetical protein
MTRWIQSTERTQTTQKTHTQHNTCTKNMSNTDPPKTWWWTKGLPKGNNIYNSFLCNQINKTIFFYLFDKVCQSWLATGRWFFPGPPVTSTNKTDRHSITEIFLKVALNTIAPSTDKTEIEHKGRGDRKIFAAFMISKSNRGWSCYVFRPIFTYSACYSVECMVVCTRLFSLSEL